MAKRWALSTGNLPRTGLPRNSVDRITDCLNITSAVHRGRKALTQPKKQLFTHKNSTYITETDTIYMQHKGPQQKTALNSYNKAEIIVAFKFGRHVDRSLAFAVCKCPWVLEKIKVSQLFFYSVLPFLD